MIGVGFPKELIEAKNGFDLGDIDDCTTVLEFTMIISVSLRHRKPEALVAL